MTLSIETFYQQGMIQLQGQGRLAVDHLIDAMEAALSQAPRGEPLRVLCDVRKMAIDAAMFDLFDKPRLLARAGLTRQDRFAVLCSTCDTQFLGMEDAALSNGYQMQAFTNKTVAIAWLRSNAAGQQSEWSHAVGAGVEQNLGIAFDSELH